MRDSLNIVRRFLLVLAAMTALTGCAQVVRRALRGPAFTHRPGPRTHHQVAMRDGVKLETTVQVPAGEGPFPVLVYRNPYDFEVVFDTLCAQWVRYGYACMHQSVRGRVGSEGTWDPMVHERDDGLDTFAWLRTQPWQDGNWALIGESYLAAVHWLVADEAPPEVKTMVLRAFGTDVYDATYADGLFRHEVLTAWAVLMPSEDKRSPPRRVFDAAERVRPAREADLAFFGEPVAWYRTWVDNPMPWDPYWRSDFVREAAGVPGRVGVPVFMIGAWSDAFLGPQFTTWGELATQDESVMYVGPYDHLGRPASDLDMPGLTEGPGADGSRHTRAVLSWLDHHLRGAPARVPTGVVQSYVGGRDTWTSYETWPPPHRAQAWFMADPAADCGGRLSQRRPAAHTADWVHDPDDPVPARGGAGMLRWMVSGKGGTPGGVIAPAPVCDRDDVRGFVSDPLEAPLHIAGRIEALLTVETTAPDTAFAVSVIEARADGRELLIREAFTTLRVHGVRGGEGPVAVTLESWPVDWEFAAGSRIRVELSSSRFPKVATHTNRAEPWGVVTEVTTARQTVHLERSSVRLPVVP